MEKRCSSQQETEKLAAMIAHQARAGDLFALSGDLGAGKSTFARAFVRAFLGDDTAEVPSPTFTLVQLYETPEGTVIHTDLYRLQGPEDVYDLGLDDERMDSILLVEWPDRMPPDWWEDALLLSFVRPGGTGPDTEEARLVSFGGNMARWQQIFGGSVL